MRPVVAARLLALVTSVGLWSSVPAIDAQGTQPTTPTALLERLHSLHLLADGLIEKAASGQTPANDFQIQARIYREQLRQIMLANRELMTAHQLPQGLLLAMVRMSALLHAAADCKSGRVIVCPPDLLRQLNAQQAEVGDALRPLAGGIEQAS